MKIHEKGFNPISISIKCRDSEPLQYVVDMTWISKAINLVMRYAIGISSCRMFHFQKPSAPARVTASFLG